MKIKEINKELQEILIKRAINCQLINQNIFEREKEQLKNKLIVVFLCKLNKFFFVYKKKLKFKRE